MAYNQNYNNARHQLHDFTFRGPPPPPHSFYPDFPPPQIPATPVMSDQEHARQWDNIATTRSSIKPVHEKITISEVKQKLRDVLKWIDELKKTEIYLKDNINTLPDVEWKAKTAQVQQYKESVDGFLADINDSYIKTLRNLLAKRSVKRMRQKRVRLENKLEKDKNIKEGEKIVRDHMEMMQKVKADIEKMEKEKEQKIHDDLVLREVLRKKSDAKKSISKLEALAKLRKARQNTAKGRGVHTSEGEAATFNASVDKLKALWGQKLLMYETEESELRVKLKEDSKNQENVSTGAENKISDNVAKWKEFLFGCQQMPQRNFNGDIYSFITLRSQWDQFLDSEGTPLPAGWVIPKIDFDLSTST